MKTFTRGEKIDPQNDYQVGLLAQHFETACGIGYAIKGHEVSSTPWEFALDVIDEVAMDSMAADGWEFISVFGCNHDQVIWRRRKGASDGQKA